jgi:dethiobiotin synthetase
VSNDGGTGVQGLFFTGTDTGVGKTVVTAAVARLLRAQGRRVRVCKPVATGATLVGGRWLSDDTIRLAEAAGDPDYEGVTGWSLSEPVAPPVAARRRGTALVLHELAEAVRRRDESGGVLLVEGVGGLLCPLTERETVADLAAALGLPLVVVTRRSLGTLNHTLLTLEVARGRNLRVAGVVVCETEPPRTLADQTNVEELVQRITVPLLGVLPHQANPFGAVPGLDGTDWWGLCHGGGR